MRIGGPNKQRDAEGEEAYLYWLIESRKDADRPIERLSPITYGEVPDDYDQTYPKKGPPPPLIEGDRYLIHIETFDASPFIGYMTSITVRLSLSLIEREPSEARQVFV